MQGSIGDIRWYHYAMYYALMIFFTGGLLIPFFPETVMQIGRFYDLHHGRTFVTVSSENDKELWELNTGLPDKEQIFKYEVLKSVKQTTFFKIIYAHYYFKVLLND